ncbi:MAG: ribosome small subunit-dependent GTPase A [Balneolia bacterium]|nr:ribosome small subunit-dependent GTPase A [Balneolia bacterium]
MRTSKKGKVIQSTGKWHKVLPDGQTGDDALVMCQLPGKFRLKELKQTNPVAVGDEVTFSVLDDGKGLISEIHDRHNKISRKATHGRKGEHILVSNLDQAFVVQAVRQPKFRTGFIDRFLVSTEAYGITPYIILNKTDLGKEEDAPAIGEALDVYTSLGYEVLLTSIHDKESIQELSDLMKGKTSVFIGPSGTGKTSLLNEIQPGIDRRVGAVSESSNKGKHTTTFSELIPLDFGGFLADTPGIREFGLVHFEPAEIALYFPEMKELREQCRFYNCSHLHEPGCAVMQAFEEQKIAPSRYESYISMYESVEDDDLSAGSRKRG